MCDAEHVVLFELHGSQSMLGPLTCYDGPHTMRKIPGTEGAAVGPSLLRTMHKASDSQLSSIPKVPKTVSVTEC